MSLAGKINDHLESGGVVIVGSYGPHTEYGRKHVGWFFTDSRGNLCVKRGKSSVCLSLGEKLLCGVRFGRYVPT